MKRRDNRRGSVNTLTLLRRPCYKHTPFMHFKELHKGDRAYESDYGTSIEFEVLTEPKETAPGVWEFIARTYRDDHTHYLMRDDSRAYAPQIARYPEYVTSFDLNGRKYYMDKLVDSLP